jgi:hypothetical protein
LVRLKKEDEGDARVDKGQKNEMDAFVLCAKAGIAMPIPVESLFDTSISLLAVMVSVRTGKDVTLTGYGITSRTSSE